MDYTVWSTIGERLMETEGTRYAKWRKKVLRQFQEEQSPQTPGNSTTNGKSKKKGGWRSSDLAFRFGRGKRK